MFSFHSDVTDCAPDTELDCAGPTFAVVVETDEDDDDEAERDPSWRCTAV